MSRTKPIRLMVSLLILKQLRNLSDESIVEQWSENAYYQYFGGEQIYMSRPQTRGIGRAIVTPTQNNLDSTDCFSATSRTDFHCF